MTIEVKPGRTGSDSDVRQFLWLEERLGDDLLEELGIVTVNRHPTLTPDRRPRLTPL